MPFPERSREDDREIAEFCRRIAFAMSVRQLSQSEVSRRVGCQQSVVSEWINGQRAPSGLYLLRLPGALEVNGHWLLTSEGEMDDAVTSSSEMPAAYARGGLAALARVEQALSETRASLLLQDEAIQRAQAAAAARAAEEVRGAARGRGSATPAKRRAR